MNDCPSVVVKDLFTLGGGCCRLTGMTTNEVLSLVRDGSGTRWAEVYPPMPTKRRGPTALCTRTSLIVAGGRENDRKYVKAVEIMDTESRQCMTESGITNSVEIATVE